MRTFKLLGVLGTVAIYLGLSGGVANAYDGDWADPLPVVGPVFETTAGLELNDLILTYKQGRVTLNYDLYDKRETKTKRKVTLTLPLISSSNKGSIQQFVKNDPDNVFDVILRTGGERQKVKQTRRILFNGEDYSRHYSGLARDWVGVFSQPAPRTMPDGKTRSENKQMDGREVEGNWAIEFAYEATIETHEAVELAVSYLPVIGDPIDRTLMQMDDGIGFGVNWNILDLCFDIHQMRLVFYEASQLTGQNRQLPYDVEMLDFDLKNPLNPDEAFGPTKAYLSSKTSKDLVSSCQGQVEQRTYRDFVWQANDQDTEKTLKRIWFTIHQAP